MKKERQKIEGNRITELLEIKGISQAQLCERTGMDKSHISRIISNKMLGITLPIAYKISVALDEPIENVFIIKF
jgi:transcriptional regulator with XRE-family HTH domain